MKEKLIKLLESRAQLFVGNDHRSSFEVDSKVSEIIQKKRESYLKREAEIVKCHAESQIVRKNHVEEDVHLHYRVHFQFLVKQLDKLTLEEKCEERTAIFRNGELIGDTENPIDRENMEHETLQFEEESMARSGYQYDRLAAVRYAERWWNSYNPKFRKFDVDCTNYISQCIHAGGVPMSGMPNRSKGWWMQNNNWSFSWSVAHSMRWYLSGAKSGLRAKEVPSAKDLLLGDVICYDFQGDGRFDHTTIVVAKDANGMPLVNAHTQNSRMRYWAYEDSTAYTPNIKYKFFSIVDHG